MLSALELLRTLALVLALPGVIVATVRELCIDI
eukprot:SAG31_NODE_29752_length_403_cov_0.986254_1_plen_32_part_01